MNDLPNPYNNTPTVRTSVRTEHTVHSVRPSIEDYNYLKTTHSRANTLQLTFYFLLTKFVNELKRANIGPQYSPDTFERALLGLAIQLPESFYGGTGSPDSDTHRENPRGDDGRGARTVALPSPGHQQQPLDVSSSGKNQKRVKKTGGKDSS